MEEKKSVLHKLLELDPPMTYRSQTLKGNLNVLAVYTAVIFFYCSAGFVGLVQKAHFVAAPIINTFPTPNQ